MRYRVLDANGDYTFGKGAANFFVDSPACVGQAVLTALLLTQGEWFSDVTAGMPWNTKVLGVNTQDVYDIAIKSVILSVQGVMSIVSYSSSLSSRQLIVNATLSTQFGNVILQAPIDFAPLALGGYGVGGWGATGYGI